ncbi:MAG TPA: glycosyltransferase, partial [Crocinitomix sp.]|nr:glycosyltransferase [Crocinitomix sp.]
KNHSFIIDIFNEIYKTNPNSVLLLIGNGNLKSQIKQKVKDLNIEHIVRFLGVQKNIPYYLQVMDVFLFPSLFEGLPVTLVEAQASGLKIITSNKVAQESKLTNLVEFMPLEKSAKEWAKTVLQYTYYKREKTSKLIIEKDYDIKKNALDLQNFYLEQNT